VSSSFIRRWRVEDVLAASFALALVAYGGVRAVIEGIRLDEGEFWDFNFIVAPVSLLIFIAAVRYAIGGGGSLLQSTVRDVLDVVRDWLPFLLFLLFYEAFRGHIWTVLHTEDRDPALLAIDRRLFGETPAVWMDRLVSRPLTDVMAAAYFLHLVLPPLVAFVWYRRDRRWFRSFLLAVLLAGLMGSVGYLAVPAVGPAVAYPELFVNELDGTLYSPVTTILDAARAPRDVFPSLHVGLSAIVLWYGAKLGRGWLLALLPLVIANWISTLYLRYHYLIDVVAGWGVAVLAIVLARALLDFEARLHSQHLVMARGETS
jgi:membrane-associated phospholipid phosphatase